MFFKLLFIFFNITHLYCYNSKYVNLNLEKFNTKHVNLNLEKFNTKYVNLYLEKFNSKYNLIHIAVVFSDPLCIIDRKICRFDFRVSNDGNSYLTNIQQPLDFYFIFPNIYIPINNSNLYRNNIDIYSKYIHWGITNKTWSEIFDYEKNFLCKRYIIGIYDCRHYTSRFTKFATGKETPIWSLNELWDTT